MERMPSLTPSEVRLPKLQTGCHPVNWALVDPWLKLCSGGGDVARLAKHLGISVTLMRRRRKALGLPALPPGRPKEKKLTEKQRGVVEALSEGKTVTDIARENNITPQAVVNTKRRAEEKKAIWDRQCRACEGRGSRLCGSDGEPPCGGKANHSHICVTCGGEGVLQ